MLKTIDFQTQGTCAKRILVVLEDDIIKDVQFEGGCNGNLQGISILVKGMKIREVIEKLKGIRCGYKPTSCPDQLAKALIEYLEKQKSTSEISVS